MLCISSLEVQGRKWDTTRAVGRMFLKMLRIILDLFYMRIVGYVDAGST